MVVGGGVDPIWPQNSPSARHRFERLRPKWDRVLVEVWDDDSTTVAAARDLIGSTVISFAEIPVVDTAVVATKNTATGDNVRLPLPQTTSKAYQLTGIISAEESAGSIYLQLERKAAAPGAREKLVQVTNELETAGLSICLFILLHSSIFSFPCRTIALQLCSVKATKHLPASAKPCPRC